jgi:hypothetical protein
VVVEIELVPSSQSGPARKDPLLRRTAHFNGVGARLVMDEHVDPHPSNDDEHNHTDCDPHHPRFVTGLVFVLVRHRFLRK